MKRDFMRAVRILFRRILSQRWGAVVIVASLAVGIGLNGALYAYFRAAFVRPYAFDPRHPVVEICQQQRAYRSGNCINSWPDVHDLGEASQSYIAMTAYHVYSTSLSIGDDEQEVEITEVDPNFTQSRRDKVVGGIECFSITGADIVSMALRQRRQPAVDTLTAESVN